MHTSEIGIRKGSILVDVTYSQTEEFMDDNYSSMDHSRKHRLLRVNISNNVYRVLPTQPSRIFQDMEA